MSVFQISYTSYVTECPVRPFSQVQSSAVGTECGQKGVIDVNISADTYIYVIDSVMKFYMSHGTGFHLLQMKSMYMQNNTEIFQIVQQDRI